jgi:AGZA family xanthine/uracil permease-like MFS transporter
MKAFVRGDLDGFLGVGLDNVVQLLIAVGLCQGVLGFAPALVYHSVLPAIALSYLVGNLCFSWMAHRLARKENRTDCCAIPYGVNTPTMIAFAFLIMLPAYTHAVATGAADPARAAWQTGLAACFCSGVVELLFALTANWIRRVTPPAAMLATLAGIGLTFLVMGFLLQAMSRPLVGLVALAVLLVMAFGRIRFRGGLTAIVVSVICGAVLAWITGLAPVGKSPLGELGLYLPHPAFLDLGMIFSPGALLPYLSVILPMSLLSGLSSLQNIESAKAAGDSYNARAALTVTGLGTIVGACLGSPFPLTIYIGHPGWKAMGARAGYSVLNGIFISLLALTGSTALIAWLLPEDAGLAIVIWIGLVIMLQAFEVVPARDWVAIIAGLLPALGAWVAVFVKTALRAAVPPADQAGIFTAASVEKWHAQNLYLDGAFALEQGFVFTATIWAAMLFYVVGRRFLLAAVWSGVGALLSLLGLIHAWKFVPGDTAMNMPLLDWLCRQPIAGGLFPAWPYAAAYAVIVAFLVVVQKWGSREGPEVPPPPAP